jgi:hypothetical protein
MTGAGRSTSSTNTRTFRASQPATAHARRISRFCLRPTPTRRRGGWSIITRDDGKKMWAYITRDDLCMPGRTIRHRVIPTGTESSTAPGTFQLHRRRMVRLASPRPRG